MFGCLQDGKIAGRAVLIAGHPGTGKTAIAMGKTFTPPCLVLLKELHHSCPLKARYFLHPCCMLAKGGASLVWPIMF